MLSKLARGRGIIPSLRVGDGGSSGQTVLHQEALFTENGPGTYTATLRLPAGNRIFDVGWSNDVLWTAATSASGIMGDDADPDGFFLATNMKATDLLVGEVNNIEHPGGLAGVYIAAEQRKLWQATVRNIIGVITSVGAGVAGRTRMYVIYSVPGEVVAAVKV